MKGGEGRRGPLSSLRHLADRFSLDSIKQRQKQQDDQDAARALERLKAQVLLQAERHRHRPLRNFAPKRGVTKRPMAHVKHERRKANKRAKLARRVNRVR